MISIFSISTNILYTDQYSVLPYITLISHTRAPRHGHDSPFLRLARGWTISRPARAKMLRITKRVMPKKLSKLLHQDLAEHNRKIEQFLKEKPRSN